MRYYKVAVVSKTRERPNQSRMHRVFWIICLLISSSVILGQSFRSYDGSFNNSLNPTWGAKGDILTQITSPAFEDGFSTMAGADRPNPRAISNYIFDQTESISDPLTLSDFLWTFGQFIEHDIVLVESNPFDPIFIEIPEDDKFFDQSQSMVMFRSRVAPGTGTEVDNPRKFVNRVTAYIDGSAIYGSARERSDWLRTFQDGKLKTSNGNLLPWNTTTGDFNDPLDRETPFMEDLTRSGQKLFVAGDVRANENPLLLTLHTLFVREHNRICDDLKAQNAALDDEQLFQLVRKKIGAYIQNITYNEWLPAMGVRLPEYRGYRADISAQISNVFSTAAFKIGCTLINSNVLRMLSDGEEISQGNMLLRDAFFNPLSINLAGGIEPYLRGMASQTQQDMDSKVIDDVRNFSFDLSAFGTMDQAAININRGRERGVSDFNTIREELGLPLLKSFQEFTAYSEDGQALENMYENVDNMDAWVGMLGEKHMSNALLGNTVMLIIERQFQNLRGGDRFYFENDPDLSQDEIEDIKNTTLRDIIMRNTEIEIMQENVFYAMSRLNIPYGPELLQRSLQAAAFPNPNTGSFKLKVYEEEQSEITVRIFDTMGRLVFRSAFNLEKGDNFMHINLPEASNSGFYNILIEKEPIEYSILRIIKN